MQDGVRTKVFKLTSGVEAEVKEFTGKEQRTLTEQKHKKLEDNLIELLSDVLIRVGTETHIDEAYVKSMLSSDRKHALVTARQFTMDFEESFLFKWPYMDSDGRSQEFEQEVALPEGVFPFKPTKMQFETYDEVLKAKDVKVVLPKSGQTIQFSLLDYSGEIIGSGTKKKQRSSHTPILMRNPLYFQEAGQSKSLVPIKVTNKELDSMHYKDIEFLRKAIKEYEGQVDTEIQFEHPEAERLAANERTVTVDLLQQVAFFFPSEAI